MPSPFAARENKLRRSVEKAFGEAFTFKAKKFDAVDVNLPRVTDDVAKPDMVDIAGLWENIAEEVFPRARGNFSDDEATRRADSFASVAIDPGFLTWTPVQGCICIRQHDSSQWVVSHGLPDDRGRIVFFLTGRKRPA